MRFIRQSGPYFKKSVSVSRMMLDVLIALIPITVFSIVIHGFNAIKVILASCICTVGLEFLFTKIRSKRDEDIKYDSSNLFSSLITGIIFALLLPSKADLYIVITGAIFAILVGKLIYGGTGANIFNPAGVGRVFVAICFPMAGEGYYNGSKYYDVVCGATPLTSLKGNFTGVYDYSLSDLFLGFAPGAMGEVSKVCLLVGALYLIIRRSADYRVIVAGILSFFILALTVGVTYKFKYDAGFGATKYALYELLAGGTVFGVVFMLTDPVTSPVTKMGRIIYATLVSVITMLVRIFGAYSEGCVFAILMANMFTPLIDYYKWSSSKITWKNILAVSLIMILAMLIIALAL